MSQAISRVRGGVGFMRLTTMFVAAVAISSLAGVRCKAYAQEDQMTPEQQQLMERFAAIQWTQGPTTAQIGTMAEIQIPEGYQFASSGDAQALLELYGNPRNPNILGAIVPLADDSNWTLIFKFDDIGYVQDADKESIDADEIISSFQSGLPDMNAARRAVGAEECKSITWMEKPF